MSVTLRFQSTGSVPGDGAPIVMIGPSLTIGRGPENDVVLPDPDRLISKNHCAIEDNNGDVTVIDFSTNGTFLNYGKNALGRVPTPLNDGDVLSMGAYELVVAITSDVSADPLAGLPPPVDDGPVSHGSAGASPESLLDLLDDPGAKKADFLDDLMGDQAPRGPSQIVREDPIDSLMLPNVGDGDDPILGPLPDPLDEEFGASHGSHSASVSDSFTARKTAKSVIPDDWDDDFLSPTPKTPEAKAPPPSPVPDLPPEVDDDLLPEPPAPSPPPKPVAEPVARPKPAAPVAEDESSPFAVSVGSSKVTSSVVPPPPPLQRAAAARPAAVAAKPPVAAKPAAAPQSHDAARAFLRGAGVEDLTITDDELAETMERLGSVMFTLISGLRDILMTRTSIKSEFRIEKTELAAGGNNPLKFALSPEHAVEFIVKPRKGYMPASAAVEEALGDIKAHEVAMVTGMEAAIKDVLGRLDPKTLEEKIGKGGGFADMLKGRKSRYWETYEKLYADISEQAEHDFHEFFSKEFAKAYKKQLERLK
ncbi:type VI secretion system-associated FHA domain protein TagH [Pseudorhodobacter sp. E13]|uniref:type VI secretion system-associated FHA domain protein TagH n=1 Tax=Pseudorhodobacter sp. E13 TaxID=2487931 RepID=UPI000F8E166B|nr:type VI secretion system-associated FHA domain protein TagH [Pseudorhodobacter sp. E13]RUS59694.1 type VI secretion system-associated FHA domain protein TagH [Pseudorhodobacter sp. E13]